MSEIATLLPFHFAFIKAAKLQKIIRHFGSLANALDANYGDWQASQLLTAQQLERLLDAEMPNWVDSALNWAEVDNQSLLGWQDAQFPKLLQEIPDPPILLYLRGNETLLADPQLAIVGSRHASRLGGETAKDFAQHLSSKGLTITSGLASGIDAAAHQGGLQEMGKTLAVVGTGIDRVYPAANRHLAQQIVDEGLMVSEYPLGTKPKPHYFPQRNRIISGLSLGVLVVEAALKSGSLITAKQAMEQGREVFAVPGAINNPHAKGCHQLIRSGAKLVESGQDILEELAPLLSFALQQVETESPQQQILERSSDSSLMQYIEYEPISLDELAVLSKMPVSEIQSQLMMLELTGELEALSAGRWRRLK